MSDLNDLDAKDLEIKRLEVENKELKHTIFQFQIILNILTNKIKRAKMVINEL